MVGGGWEVGGGGGREVGGGGGEVREGGGDVGGGGRGEEVRGGGGGDVGGGGDGGLESRPEYSVSEAAAAAWSRGRGEARPTPQTSSRPAAIRTDRISGDSATMTGSGASQYCRTLWLYSNIVLTFDTDQLTTNRHSNSA